MNTSVFGINGQNGDVGSFERWAVDNLTQLFPFSDNLYSDTEIVYNNSELLDKFKGSRIMIVGGGPSSLEVDWKSIDCDFRFTMNKFYKNEELSKCKFDLIAVGGEVDPSDDSFSEYLSEHNPLLMFEYHNKWVGARKFFEDLQSVYPQVGCFQTRAYGKLGVGVRLLIFAMYLGASEVYIVGCDGCPGLSVSRKMFDTFNHSFESGKKVLPWQITKKNAYEVYRRQYEQYWNYVLSDLKFDTRVYNLGENCDYNFSSIWSSAYFPLPSEIKLKINS